MLDDSTLKYYSNNADTFIQKTIDVDLSEEHSRFLINLDHLHGRILDAGCGSGRDLMAFKKHGFEAIGIDACDDLVTSARMKSGCQVLNMSFTDMWWEDEFIGIWSFNSLLHIPHNQLVPTVKHMRKALKKGGIWYMSFFLGDPQSRRCDKGRLFTDQNHDSIDSLIRQCDMYPIVINTFTPEPKGREIIFGIGKAI